MKILSKKTGKVCEVQFNGRNTEEAFVCPFCVDQRQKSKNKKSASWNNMKHTGKCFNCDDSFSEYIQKKPETDYYRPTGQWLNFTELSDKWVEYWFKRGITQPTLNTARVTSRFMRMPDEKENEDVCSFNYYRNDILVNSKFRSFSKKFTQISKAELILYNLDAISDSKECVITEGEGDALSYLEAGYKYAVSIPNGANNNLQYIDNCYEYLQYKELIYIATDNDEKGRMVRDELVRRLGAVRCRLVNFNDKKDANEYLVAYGKQALLDTLTNAEEIQLDGVFTCASVYDKIVSINAHGRNCGTTTHIESLDSHYTHRTGEVTLWTGYNNEGKSAFLNQLLVLKAQYDDWRIGVFSPESLPTEDYFCDIIQCYTGKPVEHQFNSRLNELELNEAAIFIDEHFFVVTPGDDYKFETIMERMRYLVFKYGVKAIVIDPYNQIEHEMNPGEREDLYISRFMGKLKKFAVENDVAIHLVAHQVTPLVTSGQDYPQPDSYKIKGGGTFSDKADNVVIVWRPFRKTNNVSTEVRVIVAKIKKQRLVGIPGEVTLYYSRPKNQYFDNPDMVRYVNTSLPVERFDEKINF